MDNLERVDIQLQNMLNLNADRSDISGIVILGWGVGVPCPEPATGLTHGLCRVSSEHTCHCCRGYWRASQLFELLWGSLPALKDC